VIGHRRQGAPEPPAARAGGSANKVQAVCRWYASRVNSRARGQSPTVCGANPDELTYELSAEETSALHVATILG